MNSPNPGPSSDAIIAINSQKEKDTNIAQILIGELKSNLPEQYKDFLFAFTGSRTYLSKIGTDHKDKVIIWELFKMAELEFISSLDKDQYTFELENMLHQITLETMLGFNLADDATGLKLIGESYKFHSVQSETNTPTTKKKPSFLNPRRYL